MSKNSCYGCTKRNEDCHSTCEEYANDVKKNEQRKQKIAEYMRGEQEYVDYMHNRSRAKDKKRKSNL